MMPEQLPKISQNPSPPVARSGAGDISESELSKERQNLQTTPPANRFHPAHPKKQLFSVPVSKFTALTKSPSPKTNLMRLRNCLNEYQTQTPKRPAKIGPKAVSMEDLTPTKRLRKQRKDKNIEEVRSPGLHTLAEEEAAVRIYRFMLLASWRRRRDEVRCLRKTLETQVSCSERLRMQVSALKCLLDSDNAKVRMAMRELERLKQLLRDKDAEKSVLEREKFALETDICTAEDRASEMSIGWRNCRNELQAARGAAAAAQCALAAERAAHQDAKLQRDHAFSRLSMAEEELSAQEERVSAAQQQAAARRGEAAARLLALRRARLLLQRQLEARELITKECVELRSRLTLSEEETLSLKGVVQGLQAQTARLAADLSAARDQLDWWPKPLTKMVVAARGWLHAPPSLSAAVLWVLVPARHGC